MIEKMRYILRILIIIMLNVFIIAVIGYTYKSAIVPKNTAVFSRIGSQGNDVRVIQEILQQKRLYTGKVDGVYNSRTANAVKDFQRRNGLTVDGIAGPATLAAMGITPAKISPGAISDSDYQLLVRLISAETGSEPFSVQVAVGAVILNRIEHPSFPDTIAGVAYQPDAFSSMTASQPGQFIAESAYRAATEALNGTDPSGGAIYFYDPDKTKNEYMLARPVILRIGRYLFCS